MILLQVPDLHKAMIFWCDGLGFTQDPGTWSKQRGGFKVLWFNLGRHQVNAGLSTQIFQAQDTFMPGPKGSQGWHEAHKAQMLLM